MQKTSILRLSPAESADDSLVKNRIASELAVPVDNVCGFIRLKQSIDARGRNPMIQLSVRAFINEPVVQRKPPEFSFPNVRKAKHQVVIVGAGPAGLFAALRSIEKGIKPIVLERGKDVRSRRRDLARLNREGEVNPESNYCFGEGGAGTYSDGKLYTRSSKRGDLERILELFVHFGADDNILYESHPHIGTNKLPHIITAMRNTILDRGGEIHFEKKLTGITRSGRRVSSVSTADGESFPVEALILATGHSARDIFLLLQQENIFIESKPFALGVRVEHPQAIIDSIQYLSASRGPFLPPAAYSWVQQVADKGVFSFCMCPGGIIAPAATAGNEVVVNGWSPSKRNNPFANSGIVVTVETADAVRYFKQRRVRIQPDALLLMNFQADVEQRCFEAGGGDLVAPALRLADFTAGKQSADLPSNSYLPGLRPAGLQEILPDFIHTRLQKAFEITGKKMKGYLTNEAVVVATESRTSSPVRIPRDSKTLAHIEFENLYPCGEGAGYAGGIISAAMDGEKIMDAAAAKWLA